MSVFQHAWRMAEIAAADLRRVYALEHRICRRWRIRGYPNPDDSTDPVVTAFDVKIDARRDRAKARLAATQRLAEQLWHGYSRSLRPVPDTGQRRLKIAVDDFYRGVDDQPVPAYMRGQGIR